MFHIAGSPAAPPVEEPGPAIAAVPPTAVRIRVVCCLIAGTGLVLVVAGSFLPWVISGTVRRSSYAIVGVIDRLGIAGDGVLSVLIRGWPLVGVLCMAPVVTGCLRWWRTAGGLGVLVGLAAGLLSLGIVLVATGRVGLTVRLDPIGPAVMAAGAILLLGGAGALALGAGSPIRRTINGPNANDRP